MDGEVVVRGGRGGRGGWVEEVDGDGEVDRAVWDAVPVLGSGDVGDGGDG